jgi:hypothetical protein
VKPGSEIPPLTPVYEGAACGVALALTFTRRCPMNKIMLSLIAGIGLASFSSLSFSDEMGKMKDEMMGEMGKIKEDVKGEQDKMKGDVKGEMDKMKADVKGKADEMKGKGDTIKKKEETMKGEMKGMTEDTRDMMGK